MASRHGQLAFDFRLDAAPAKILTLQRPADRRPARTPAAAEVDGARDTALAEEYFRAASALDDGDEAKLEQAAAAYRKALECDPYLVAGADQPGERALQPRRAGRSAGAVRASHRSGARFFRGALQPREHLPRPRPVRRGAGMLSAKRCGSIRSTPTRTSIWPSRSRRWDSRRKPGRTGGRTRQLAPHGEWVELAKEFSE